ncbi:helix-turn-helix domain-containing protein [Mesorhizobium sp. DCY119]|uniref:helix-turn-helix domain-containing protein n=1 Tax=Mesorhizobium sp. DCY119 TaxID=2108445 RepID=UPI0026BC5D12
MHLFNILNLGGVLERTGAERILDAVEWFATTTSSVTYTDFVQALDVPKSSALLLLRLLVARGYVQRLPDNRYVLVRLPGEMLGGGGTWGTILRLADRHLRDAVATIEETGSSPCSTMSAYAT